MSVANLSEDGRYIVVWVHQMDMLSTDNSVRFMSTLVLKYRLDYGRNLLLANEQFVGAILQDGASFSVVLFCIACTVADSIVLFE